MKTRKLSNGSPKSLSTHEKKHPAPRHPHESLPKETDDITPTKKNVRQPERRADYKLLYQAVIYIRDNLAHHNEQLRNHLCGIIDIVTPPTV